MVITGDGPEREIDVWDEQGLRTANIDECPDLKDGSWIWADQEPYATGAWLLHLEGELQQGCG